MFDQDRSPPTKRAVEVSPSGPSRIGPSEKKVTQDCPELPGKSSGSGDRQARFLRTVKGALASDGTGLWPGLTIVARIRLTVQERAALAFSMLRSLPPDEREATVDTAWFAAERPPSLLIDEPEIMAEARLRAVAMTRRQRKAELAANFQECSNADRGAFIAWAQRIMK